MPTMHTTLRRSQSLAPSTPCKFGMRCHLGLAFPKNHSFNFSGKNIEQINRKNLEGEPSCSMLKTSSLTKKDVSYCKLSAAKTVTEEN